MGCILFERPQPAVQHYTFTAGGAGYDVNIPLADFAPDGGVYVSSCADVGASMFGGSCTKVGASCVCSYAPSGLATYEISGNSVTMTLPSLKYNNGYCVTDGSLAMSTRFGNFLTSAVFTRQ